MGLLRFQWFWGQPVPDEGEAVGYQGMARAMKTALLWPFAVAKAPGQPQTWSKRQQDDQGQREQGNALRPFPSSPM